MIRTRYSTSGGDLRLRSSQGGSALSGVSVTRNSPKTSNVLPVKATWYPTLTTDTPVSLMPSGGVVNNKMFTGILSDAEEINIPFYRDCYYYDSVAGATVDIIASFPFSDWTLVGLEKEDTEIYNENLARLNMRSMLPEISNSYLVDGAFIGSLVYDSKEKVFQDVLIHDRINCQVSPRPFFSLDPVITANSANHLQSFLSSHSPYTEAVMSTYPRQFLNTFMQGAAVLDPLTTIYIPRKGLADSTTTSYLKRILPMYLLEKLLYRGTLIEATKRMRATTHIQVGTDAWEPTPAEMQAVLANFQMTDMDPLGAWLVTRQGVQVSDIRAGGDFWKWTDVIDALVPYKLRALGISEAFLSGDANVGNGETALNVFMENMNAYREFLTHRVFRDRLFPLIAVSNGMYKDKNNASKERSINALMRNLGNHKNLRIPDIRWHKTLENHDPQIMDTLEKLTEKGIPVPLKMWAVAANVSLDMLLGDLQEDQIIRDKIEKITGTTVSNRTDKDGMGFEDASLRALEAKAEIRSGKSGVFSRRRSLLQREFAGGDPTVKMSKSGNKIHSVSDRMERQLKQKQNENIMHAFKRLQNPEYRRVVNQRVISKLGKIPNLIDR